VKASQAGTLDKPPATLKMDLTWPGGLPVIMNGKVVGAVGVSGLPEEEDMELAELGVAAIMRTAQT
jgi:uncharacterized protein GlcG (DUF336 family)